MRIRVPLRSTRLRSVVTATVCRVARPRGATVRAKLRQRPPGHETLIRAPFGAVTRR